MATWPVFVLSRSQMLIMGRAIRNIDDNVPQELVLGPVYKYVYGQGTYFSRVASKAY
jgi:hypothetical protein